MLTLRYLAALCSLTLLGACDTNTTNPDAGGADASVADAGSDAGTAGSMCGDGVVQAPETCDDRNDDDFDGCAACRAWPQAMGTPLTLGAARAWEYFEIDGAICRDGSPAGLAVSANPDSDDVVIFFEGGGACFNASCEMLTSDTVYREPREGIFERGNADNPLADWNMVYVPYCTGDVFAGNRPNATVPGVDAPQNFVGYANIGRFLTRLVPTFRTATRVLLTGSSAGGFGAAANYQQVADAFGPITVMLLDDSGPPMGPDVAAPCLQQQWREVWNLDDTVLADCGADCPDPNNWILDLAVHLMRRYPDRPAALYSRTGDFVIRGFYGYGLNECSPGFLPQVPLGRFVAGLEGFRAASQAEGGVFKTFFAEGSSHTCISQYCFYEEQSGTSLAAWVGELIEGTAEDVGP